MGRCAGRLPSSRYIHETEDAPGQGGTLATICDRAGSSRLQSGGSPQARAKTEGASRQLMPENAQESVQASEHCFRLLKSKRNSGQSIKEFGRRSQRPSSRRSHLGNAAKDSRVTNSQRGGNPLAKPRCKAISMIILANCCQPIVKLMTSESFFTTVDPPIKSRWKGLSPKLPTRIKTHIMARVHSHPAW